MRSVFAYTAARIAIFAVTAALLYVTTPMAESPVLLLCVSLLLSGLISYVLLSAQRDAMSSAMLRARTKARERMAERTTRED